MKKKYRISEIVLDLMFPPRCPLCDHVIEFRKGDICGECVKRVKPISGSVCMKCGKPLEEEKEYCFDCKTKKHLYVQGISAFEYRDIAASIYRFKYGERQEYAAFFGRCMARKLEKKIKQWKAEALVPVPVHPSRKRERGYNQAELLAKEIAVRTGVPMRCDIVARSKKTMPQKSLDGVQRQNNLKKAFKILKNDVKLNTIVIIDDIYTTGSTVDAMAAILRTAGVKNIYYAALAIGRGQ